jgi:hypothetical protein
MKTKIVHLVLVTALAAGSGLVASCGGGGDTAPLGTPQGPIAFNVQAAVSAMFDTAATYDMSGSVPASETGTTAIALHETDTFVPGAPADPLLGNGPTTLLIRTASPPNVSIGVTTPQSGTETYNFTRAPFRLVARKRADGLVERFTFNADLPSAALIGQSGLAATFGADGGASANQLGWSVEAAETSDTAWVCLLFVQRQITNSQCVRTDSKGAILGARVVNSGPLLGLTADLRSPAPSH